MNINTHISSVEREFPSSGFLRLDLDGWDSDGGGGRLVDPFLMCNDGFMPRISPLEDLRRLWKGSKWPIAIQIRAKGGESRFIFFLLAG